MKIASQLVANVRDLTKLLWPGFQSCLGRAKSFNQGGGRAWPKSRHQVPELVEWYMNGKLKIDELCTASLPLDRINEAFTMMERQQGIRTVITF